MTTTPAQSYAYDFDAHVMDWTWHLACTQPGYGMVLRFKADRIRDRNDAELRGRPTAHVVAYYEYAKGRQLSDSPASPDPDPDFSDIPLLQVEHLCYQCMQPAAYLFNDGRCCHCTRLLPEEIVGSVYEHSPPLDDEITVLLNAAFGLPALPSRSVSLVPSSGCYGHGKL